MLSTIGGLFVVAYLPGAAVYRLPTDDRAWRMGRPAEERVFWAVLLSTLITSAVALTLAGAGTYTYGRLLAIDAAIAFAVVAWARRRLVHGRSAPRPTWSALVPVGLVALGLWLYFPPAEYLAGGRDPGVYMHEGIQIAQRGSVTTTDADVAAVPRASRGLFFPDAEQPGYDSIRFMGFFVTDLDRATVVGQFPHVYPVWIAIGYGLDGLTGARRMTGWWAIFGLVAVYFAGVRLFGRLAAAIGAALLAANVASVWFARYPNSEVMMQALLFGALLAHAYAHERSEATGGRYFAVATGLLLGILPFVRFPGVIAIAAAVGATVIIPAPRRGLYVALLWPLAAAGAIALLYYSTLLAPYSARPMAYLASLEPLHLALWSVAGIGGTALVWAARTPSGAKVVRHALPLGLAVSVVLGAFYTYFLREPGGRLAPQDAYAVRQLADFYITPVGLAAGVVGFALVVRRSFWNAHGLLLVVSAFAAFYLYKMRIYPEHFWTARRYLPAIMPTLLLSAAGAACWPLVAREALGGFRWRGLVRVGWLGAGLGVVTFLGWQFWMGTRPILAHVEHAGLISRLEAFAETIGDDELVIVEAREASDLHILALPLAYTYARNVLVLARAEPDREAFEAFLAWANTRYRRVLFMGGGGTEVLSRSIRVIPLVGERFQVPQWEMAELRYPDGVRQRQFNFGVYELVAQPVDAEGFDLDVGAMDDLYLRRFHAKEQQADGMTFRWTQDRSYVSIVGTTPDSRTLAISMTNGGRPTGVSPASVTVTLDEISLGTVDVSSDYRTYRFDIPPPLVEALATRNEAGQLRLTTSTWSPSEALGVGDTRELGVIVDHVALETGNDAP